MKSIFIIVAIALLAWFRPAWQPKLHALFSKESGPVTQSVEYTKCTTADGRVIYSQQSTNSECQTIETISSEMTIVPSGQLRTIKSGLDPSLATESFRCDSRQYCSQMTSRAEALFFIQNCPNTKMDGDRDGDPCENDSRFQ